ncbi:uncharacterized protein LOC134679525 isoform X2 [Cydia fagiglandana]|uniref:uncharacterized protein LOC134663581 isoform X2 n=2 Tax=Cydia fagiglandana TaxID=1458189 RepID=UPI002FEE36FB
MTGIMDLNIGLVYLHEWGISAETIKRFEDNNISLELMKCMKSEELQELIPNIRDRILFKSGLEQLYKVIDETSTEAATTSDIDSSNDGISAPCSPSGRASSLSSVSSCNENPRSGKNPREIDITTILNDNNHGKLVLARLKTCKKLDATFRSHLTKSIVEWYLKHNECMKKEDFMVIAEAIQVFIPTELKETYYIPGLKYNNKYRPAKGKLIDRYNNQRRLLKREGVLGRKRKLQIENIDQEHSDIEEDEETVIWLQYNKEPFQEVKDKWLQTRKYRIQTDYKNSTKNLQDILKKYPLLKQSFGFQLIELDFEYSHPKRGISLFVKFPEFLEKANAAFIGVKVFQDLKILFNNTTQEDTKTFIALSLLCGKLVPTVGRSDNRRNDKNEKRSSKDLADQKKYNKPTILESRDSLILHVKTQSDIQNCLATRRDIHLKKGLTCQPVVICVGPDVENITEFYVNFDDVTYQLESLLKAVDICFKTFHVFDIKYPRESIQPWMFIQRYFYEIHTPQDHTFPSVATLIADLM